MEASYPTGGVTVKLPGAPVRSLPATVKLVGVAEAVP